MDRAALRTWMAMQTTARPSSPYRMPVRLEDQPLSERDRLRLRLLASLASLASARGQAPARFRWPVMPAHEAAALAREARRTLVAGIVVLAVVTLVVAIVWVFGWPFAATIYR